MFKKITIIGVGLIGSSLARAIRRHNLTEKLVLTDASEEVLDKARELELADVVTPEIAKSVIGSDLVILAVPLSQNKGLAEKICPMMAPGAILSDVGSTKSTVIKDIEEFLPESVDLVPAHPIAGTEHSGPEAGFAELFVDRWCILTPTDKTPIKSVEKITALWEAFGSKIEIMDPEHHDLVLAITSHLPHLIAYTIVGTADDLEDDTKAEVIKFCASGFQGFTRIAASDPVMWRDVFLNNKDAVLEILQRFNEDLTAMQKAIRRGDGKYLEEAFTRTREIRREVIEMGATAYPNPKQERPKG